MSKTYYVYIMTNHNNTVLYTGVTSDLLRRVEEHKLGRGGTFSTKYKLCKLLYYREFGEVAMRSTKRSESKVVPVQKRKTLFDP